MAFRSIGTLAGDVLRKASELRAASNAQPAREGHGSASGGHTEPMQSVMDGMGMGDGPASPGGEAADPSMLSAGGNLAVSAQALGNLNKRPGADKAPGGGRLGGRVKLKLVSSIECGPSDNRRRNGFSHPALGPHLALVKAHAAIR